MNNIYLSVIIPCFEEKGNLRKGVLEKMYHYLSRQSYTFEVIIVDDGSRDGSVEFIEKFIKNHNEFSLIKGTHTGKSGAVTKGMLKANGEYQLFTDMDQATPIEEIEKLLPYFNKKYDIVIGSRNNERKGSPLIRRFISRSSIVLRKMIVGLPKIMDTQCGFKVFSKESSINLFNQINLVHNGFKSISGSSVASGFDVELLFLADKKGYRIKEVPVEWMYVETRRVNPIKDSIDGVKELLLIKQNALTGKYSL